VRIAIAGATGLVGRALTLAAEDAGHHVVEISRVRGVDLLTADGLDLTGVDVVIDVTNAPTRDPWRDGHQAKAFFEAVARNLGAAARAAGVTRTVVLSVLGVDRTPDDGRGIHAYYAAKLAHEQATRRHAPNARILRSAQFHELAGQMLSWKSDGARAEIPDMPMQPVAVDEVAATLLDLAVGADRPEMTELAGPRRERLPDLVARLDETVLVSPSPVSASIADGAFLPGPSALTADDDFDDWLLSPARP
jgi:uncharacterized protein YbjT (DUF2867 family)